MSFTSNSDCGNSPKMKFLEDFNRALATADFTFIEASISDDIEWTLVGHFTKTGKEAYLTTMRAMYGTSPMQYAVETVIAHGKDGAVEGHIAINPARAYKFVDIITFSSASGSKIKSIKSYVIH